MSTDGLDFEVALTAIITSIGAVLNSKHVYVCNASLKTRQAPNNNLNQPTVAYIAVTAAELNSYKQDFAFLWDTHFSDPGKTKPFDQSR